MSRLRLVAADAEDLQILSARLQDAVLKLKDVSWQPKKHRFAAVVNRLVWEDGGRMRVRAGLHFDGVLNVQSSRVKLGAGEAVIDLLALTFTANGGEDPGGVIELVLAGGGAIRLTVECIEAELVDLTEPWAAIGRPNHESAAIGRPDHESAAIGRPDHESAAIGRSDHENAAVGRPDHEAASDRAEKA